MISVNNHYRLTISPNTQQINIPIKIDFDDIGKEQDYVEFEKETLEKIINPPQDFEIARFPNKEYFQEPVVVDLGPFKVTIFEGGNISSITHKMFFFDNETFVSASTVNNWDVSYLNQGFTVNEIFYGANSFKNSFFKLDFYDVKDTQSQKIYFTVILPTQQGKTTDVTTTNIIKSETKTIKIPDFELNYTGDKEGFFLYWLKDRDYINLNEFYVSCKFFNAKTGEFVRMMNTPQASLPNKFNFNKNNTFYYKCVLDYNTYEYEIFREDPQNNLVRVGTLTNPIAWYEYVNP